MTENHYRKLPSGPSDVPSIENESLLDIKYLNITLRDYLLFFGSVVLITILNLLFRDYLYQLSLEIIMEI